MIATEIIALSHREEDDLFQAGQLALLLIDLCGHYTFQFHRGLGALKPPAAGGEFKNIYAFKNTCRVILYMFT